MLKNNNNLTKTQFKNYSILNISLKQLYLIKTWRQFSKNKIMRICFETNKFKKRINYMKINRWKFLENIQNDKIVNLKKYLW